MVRVATTKLHQTLITENHDYLDDGAKELDDSIFYYLKDKIFYLQEDRICNYIELNLVE